MGVPPVKYTSRMPGLDELLVQHGIDPTDVSDVQVGIDEVVVNWWDTNRESVYLGVSPTGCK